MIIITADKFAQYEEIRLSGVTNMFAISTVCDLSDDLTKGECLDIMKNYSDYREKYKGTK